MRLKRETYLDDAPPQQDQANGSNQGKDKLGEIIHHGQRIVRCHGMHDGKCPDATIICERDSHKGIIIGKKGSMLKKIGSTARYEIEKMLDQQVNLKLWVKVKKDWRDSEFLMKNFGYREDE